MPLVFCLLVASSSLLSAATITGFFTNVPPGVTVDLSGEGQLDWGHWGQPNEWSYNHKYGVTQQITNAAFITDSGYGDGPAFWEGGTNVFGWTNGTPTRVVAGTTNGVSIAADKLQGNATGFQFQCRADTAQRKLKVYVATTGANASFKAQFNSSGPSYSDSLQGSGVAGSLNRVYVLTFQGDSPNDVINVTFTSSDKPGFLTLQAASVSGTNAPPTAAISTPADGTAFPAPATFSLSASAGDSDGTVTNLALYKGSAPLGRAGGGSLNLTVTNLPTGAWNLFAVATDNAGLSATSFPVNVYVITNGGTLLGSVATPPGNVNLTAEGTTDWAHWGLTLPTSFDRKAGVAQRIPNVTVLYASTNDLIEYNEVNANLPTYSWTDGTPTAQIANSSSGIFIYGTNNPPGGFQLTVPATNVLRRLKVYVGLYAAQGCFTAKMSDWSAPPFIDSSLASAYGDNAAVYTLTFASTNPGANLVVTWTPMALFRLDWLHWDWGNVTWQAATLEEAPALAPIANRTITAGTLLTFTNTASATTPGPLTFSLAPGAAANASVTTDTGVFTWTPTAAQVGTSTFSVVVADSGSPPLSATQTFSVTVVASNTPPVLTAISNQTIAVGMALTITNTATDSDLPAQALTFSLASGGATNAIINATNGLFTWTPTAAQVGTNTFSVVVTDSGSPPLTATQTFRVTVVASNSVPRPVLAVIAIPSAPRWALSFHTEAGPNYALQYIGDLGSTNWQVLSNFTGWGGDFTYTNSTLGQSQGFYRVKVQ
jgi:hypothetical protein